MNKSIKSFVADKVRSGEYPSEEAVYEAGIEALQVLEKQQEVLRRELQVGIDDVEAGRISERTAVQIARDTKREMQRG